MVYSGAYRCVCVQIKLHHMAVNATAQAGVIEELEGAALHDSSLDPQGSGPAFKVLKQLVSNWLTDAVQNHNRCVLSSTPSAGQMHHVGQKEKENQIHKHNRYMVVYCGWQWVLQCLPSCAHSTCADSCFPAGSTHHVKAMRTNKY